MSDLPAVPESAVKPPSGGRIRLRTFRALRHYNYRLYFLGQLISLLGSWMQITAMTWLAYSLTHQSFWTGLIMTAQVLPTFLLGVWGGHIADRWPRRGVVFASQACLLLLALLLAGLTLAGLVRPWHLLLISLGNGLVTALDLPARLTFIHDLVGPEDLINAVGLNSLLFNSARAIGPALGALTLPTLGAGLCFLINALSFLAVLAALALMDDTRLGEPGGARSPTGRQPFLQRMIAPLREGCHYLASRPGLQLLLILIGFLALFGWPVLILLPALSREDLGGDPSGSAYSWLLSSIGLGSLLAALVVASFGSRSRSWWFLVFGVALAGLGELGLSLARSILQAQVCCVVVGSGLVLVFATAQSLMQLSACRHNRGVIMGIWSMVLSGAQQLGSLLGGRWADLWGVPRVLLLQAGGSLVLGGLLLALAVRFPPEPGGE